MEIKLHPETAKFVNEQVQAGNYTDISEVIEDALNLLQNRKLTEAERAAKLERLRKDIQIGMDQLDRGEGAPWDVEEIKAEGRRRLENKKQ